MRPWLACAILLLTGCLSGPDRAADTPPVDTPAPTTRGLAEVAEVLPFGAAARDGVALRGHVYLPDTPEPHATVLIFSPYWNGGSDIPTDNAGEVVDGRQTMSGEMGPLIEAGFAVALVNLRGTGLSDGCYSYMQHAVNGPDANAVVDALAAQPWSNGNVGMYGISYMGAVQYAALAAGPSPHLKALVPVSGEWDEWNLLGRWGVGVAGGWLHPFNRVAQQGGGALGAVPLVAGGPVPRPEDLVPRPHLCATSVTEAAAWSQLSTTGDKDAFLRDRDLRHGLANSTVPVFATNGMLVAGEGHILQFEGLWDILPGDKRLMVGQWPHAFPEEDSDAFGKLAVAWFDHYLRGGPQTVQPGVVEYQDDAMDWHTADRWPPPAVQSPLHLSAGGLVADPADAAPSATTFPSMDVFPDADLCAPTQAVYVSPPLAEDVVLAGNFYVDLTLASTLPDGNLVAALWRIDAPLECPAAAATGASDVLVGHAVSDLYHRGYLEVGSDFPTGTPSNVTLRSLPLAARLYAGERLVLAVSGGAADSYHPDEDKPVLTLRTGADMPSWLTLPVVEGALRFQA